MQEIWKDIPNYEGIYQISNHGRIRSNNPGNKRFHNKTDHILKAHVSNTGYCQVTLYKDGVKRRKYTVHKLVATMFIPNPDNLPCVNHKDENKLNNHVDNLEWCTYAYNNAYGTAKIRSIITVSEPVEQYTLEGLHIATYLSATVASKLTGINKTDILKACKGLVPYAGGYGWIKSDKDHFSQ